MATRKLLDSLLLKNVCIKLPYHTNYIMGILHKTNNATKPELYLKPNYYYVTNESGVAISCLFRASHVKSIKNLDIDILE